MAKGQIKQKTDFIDPAEVEKLAKMQCTIEEIADFFDVSHDTIQNEFSCAIKKGRSGGRMSMKRALFQKVEAGDLGAIVWWGKNFAGMSDKIEQKAQVENKQELSDLGKAILDSLKKQNG